MSSCFSLTTPDSTLLLYAESRPTWCNCKICRLRNPLKNPYQFPISRAVRKPCQHYRISHGNSVQGWGGHSIPLITALVKNCKICQLRGRHYNLFGRRRDVPKSVHSYCLCMDLDCWDVMAAGRLNSSYGTMMTPETFLILHLGDWNRPSEYDYGRMILAVVVILLLI